MSAGDALPLILAVFAVAFSIINRRAGEFRSELLRAVARAVVVQQRAIRRLEGRVSDLEHDEPGDDEL